MCCDLIVNSNDGGSFALRHDLSAIILAGGKSKRMGRDKSFLKIKGKTFLDIAIERMCYFSDDVLISANFGQDVYKGCKVIKDRIEDAGPLSGIITCLEQVNHQKVLITAVDTPFLSKNVYKKLLEFSGDYDVILARHNGVIEPLIGVYKKEVKYTIEKLLARGRLRVLEICQEVKCVFIDFGEEAQFANLNFFDEYLDYLRLHGI